MARLTEDQLAALIRDVQSWAPDADPALVEGSVRRAWGIMEADPYGIAPIAFIGALLRVGLGGEAMEAVLRIAEHLVESMAEWQPVAESTETGGRYDA